MAAVGVVAALGAVVIDRSDARSAASQVWSPFVLVAGLLLVGLVADRDGIFAAGGRRLAGAAPSPLALFVSAAATIAVVAAVLNLDTAVVFLTPVVIHAARSRGQSELPLVIGCVLLSNAGSLLLPGSNLTNLIVLGQLHLGGGQYLVHMAVPWVASVLLTAGLIALAERRSLGKGSEAARAATEQAAAAERPAPVAFGLGLVAVVAVAVLVVVLRSPALPVLGVGLVVTALRLGNHRIAPGQVRRVLGLPVLVGLFGIAMTLGTLGRAWSGPATLLSHLDAVETALFSAGASVLVNNLPAASILAARVPPRPFALLVGLDLGPNLFVTGSLAWVLWWRTARASGTAVPLGRAVAIGAMTVPLSMAGALAALALTGAH